MKPTKRKKSLTRSSLLTCFLLVAVGMVFSGFSLALSGQDDISWGGNVTLFWLNTIPVLLVLLCLWLATGYAWVSVLVSGTLLFLLTGGCYFKVLFRDDPMVWGDLSLIKEAFQMSDQYNVALTPLMYLWIGVILAAGVLLFFLAKGRPQATVRMLTLTAAGMALLLCFNDVYPDNQLYTDLAGDHANNETEAYLACGVVYPFLHSAGEADLSGDAAAGEAILAQYTDADIPEDQKVSLVTIQLEAFADLSVFDIDGISDSVYADYHALQAESYTGSLVTDIFAGGTAESEWAVLTGGNQHGDFLTPTNSVAWYFRSQGYTVNGGHPSHSWFYDRETANPSLGFDDYLFMENYYADLSTDEDVAYDDVFFPDLEKRLGEYFAENDQPLFSFNVTYQGHGPYPTEFTYWGESYFRGTEYSSEAYYAMNNYLHLVQDTSAYLVHLKDYLESLDQPVILMLYGDHKPWMGNHGIYYEDMGVDLDTDTADGFFNYYTTQYLIWANSAAKEVLGQDFVGEGPDLSPCFLMDHLFQLCGWEGSAYMQAQRTVADTLPVLHTTGWVEENGELTDDPSPAAIALMERFQNLSAYDRTHFSYSTD